jgi:hypothetical protein
MAAVISSGWVSGLLALGNCVYFIYLIFTR